VVIKASGNYDHVAYQADDTYTVEFRPLSVAEQEKKQLPKARLQRRAPVAQLPGHRGPLGAPAAGRLHRQEHGVSDTVAGRITLRLKNVPWDQGPLDIILKTKGLSLRRERQRDPGRPDEEIAAREKLELESTKQVQDLTPLRSDLIRMNFAKAADIAAMLKATENRLMSDRGNVTVDERTNTLLVRTSRPSSRRSGSSCSGWTSPCAR